MIAADLDRDGDRDLATVNQGSDNATVLRNSGTAEFTEFATSPEPVGGRPLDLVAANFDGVMGADLASANADDNDVSILANSVLATSSSRRRAPSRPAAGRIRSPLAISMAMATPTSRWPTAQRPP